jgi:hypothetical protein
MNVRRRRGIGGGGRWTMADERKKYRVHNLDRMAPKHTKHYGGGTYDEDGFCFDADTEDEAIGFARDQAAATKQHVVVRDESGASIWDGLCDVKVDGTTYRVVYVGADHLGTRYQAFRLSNGKEELAADIHRLNTGDRIDTFPTGMGAITQELANRIAIAARQAGLVK